LEPDGVTPQETTEADFRWSLAMATQDGVDRDAGSGLSATVSGNNLVLNTGRGAVAGYSFAVDAPEPVPVPTNGSALTRIFRLVARLDVAASRIYPHVLVGTASSNPQPPALTQTDAIYDLPLWRCRRTGGGGAISQLVSERFYLNPSGAPTCTSTTRPPNPLPGTLLYESDTGRLVIYHGGQWRTVADSAYPTAWTPIALRSSRYKGHSNGFTPAWRFREPGRVELRGAITRTTEDAALISGDYIGELPAAARPAGFVRFATAAHARAGSTPQTRGTVVRIEIKSKNAYPDDGQITLWTDYNPEWAALDGIEYNV
jgi:hypothetical protein